jgi:hypothetical protein
MVRFMPVSIIFFNRDTLKENNMETHHLKATISDDRRLVINGFPFCPGDIVEITIRAYHNKMMQTASSLYPLRDKPFRYADPFGSVAEDDWDVLK